LNYANRKDKLNATEKIGLNKYFDGVKMALEGFFSCYTSRQPFLTELFCPDKNGVITENSEVIGRWSAETDECFNKAYQEALCLCQHPTTFGVFRRNLLKLRNYRIISRHSSMAGQLSIKK
jgi:hypothetical protein